MTGGWARNITAGIVIASANGLLAHSARAQDVGSAFSVTGTVRSTVEIDDNPSLIVNPQGTETTFGTQLGLDIVSQTPLSQLELSFGGTVQFQDSPDGFDDNGFVDPFANFRFEREGADTLLTLDGSYRESDLVDSLGLDTDADLINDLFLSSVGELESLSLGGTFSFGIDAPFGADLSLRREERDYSNTISNDVFDNTTDTARVDLRFRLAPTATARVFTSVREYDAEDLEQTERTTQAYGVGLTYEINPVLTFDGEISLSEIEETELVFGTPVTTEDDGVEFDLSLTRELPNGSIVFEASRDVATSLSRSQFLVTRAMDLPTGGLSYSLGVSESDVGDTVLIGSVDYSREFPTGVISASLSRTASIDSDEDEIARTTLNIDYLRELTPVAGLEVGLNLAKIDDIGAGVVDEGTRADFSVTYRHQLTEDWDWTLGYVGRYSDPEDTASRTSNAIVTSIGRSFSIRP